MIPVITASVMALSVMTTSVVTTSAMCISVIAIFVIPILDGSCPCISDCFFSADHVNGDNLGDGYISDSFLCDAYQ